MGGRLGMHYIRRYPVRKAFLIGASPGLQDTKDRARRRESDQVWISQLMCPSCDMEAFCQAWEAQELIRPQTALPEPLRTQVRTRRRSQNPPGLAMALSALGTGSLPGLWDQLADLPELHLFFGERDIKFRDIARRMCAINADFSAQAVPSCGHAPHLENPAGLAALMEPLISV